MSSSTGKSKNMLCQYFAILQVTCSEWHQMGAHLYDNKFELCHQFVMNPMPLSILQFRIGTITYLVVARGHK